MARRDLHAGGHPETCNGSNEYSGPRRAMPYIYIYPRLQRMVVCASESVALRSRGVRCANAQGDDQKWREGVEILFQF